MILYLLPTPWYIGTPDQSDNPEVFPFLPGQGFLISKRPRWNTKVQQATSGKEVRASYWNVPRWNFKVSYEVLRKTLELPELEQLVAFFNMHRGQFLSFLYFDRTDNVVVDQQIGIGTGSLQDFQLTRSIDNWIEPIYATNGEPLITVDGVATTDFVQNANGMVHLNTAPTAGQVVRWSGSFYFVCRFVSDEIDLQQIVTHLWNLKTLEWISEKP